jgi:hypothetical protein
VAYADSYDAAACRYRGLEAGRRPNVQLNSESVVVKPEIAAEQMEKEATQASMPTVNRGSRHDSCPPCRVWNRG